MVNQSEHTKSRNEADFAPQFRTFYDQSILPPTVALPHNMTIEEFGERFPVRKALWDELSDISHVRTPEEQTDLLKKKTWLRIANNLQQYALDHHAAEAGLGIRLRERQMSVFDDVSAAIEHGDREMHVEAPPGFGKTVLFNQIALSADVPTIIVVPTKDLVSQTYKRFQEHTPDISVGRVFSDAKEYGRRVTITTYDSLVGDEGKLIDPEGVGLLILDEMHRGTSAKRIEAIQRVEAYQDAILMGFSATPLEITDKKVEHTRVARMSKNKVHKITDREAVEEGYTAPFSVIYNMVDVDLSNVKVNAKGDYSEEDLEEKINTEAENKAAVDFFLATRDAIKKRYRDAKRPEPRLVSTMVFVKSVKHAQVLAEEYRKAGINAAAVWGEQNTNERDAIREDFDNEQDIEVLVNNKYLGEGTDIKPVKVVILVSPTRSKGFEKQRVGRGSRLDPNDPFKHLVVGEFIYKNAKGSGQITYPMVTGAVEMIRANVEPEEKRPDLGGGGGGIDLSYIQIEGLNIITNPEEVMRVTKSITPDQGGIFGIAYELLSTRDLAAEFGTNDVTVLNHARRLQKTNPDLFRRAAFPRSPYYITNEGQSLLRSSLERLKPQPGFSALSVRDLSIKYGVSETPIRSAVAQLQREHPSAIRYGRTKNLEITDEGKIQLDSLLDSSQKKAEGYFPIPRQELMQEFSMSASGLSARLNSLIQKYPKHFKAKVDLTGTKILSYSANEEGLRLLRESYANKQLVQRGLTNHQRYTSRQKTKALIKNKIHN
jgi:superfamily II DNA or RNA helicase